MLRLILAAGLVAAVATAAPAGVVVLANFTPAPVTVTIAEPGQKPRAVALAASEVARVVVRGPADLVYPARPAEARARVDPYHAYVLVPDEAAGRRLAGVELPGKPPERDARPDADPPPSDPVEVRVKLLVDDADPRADALWQKTLKARLFEAAAVVEAHSGVRLVLADFGTWTSDPAADNLPRLLADFADKVKVGPGELAVGYTSRKLPPADPGFGEAKGFPSRHVLLREWRPRTEPARVEVLLHHLGLALGAVPLPDPGSVMRPKLADGLANHTEYKFRFDPLNALAMSVWAEERRRGPLGEAADASAAGRARLARVYGAILKARPGEPRALAYLNALDAAAPAAVAQAPPEPKKGVAPVPPAPADPPAGKLGRDEVAAAVVRGVAARAKKLGATQVPRTGDDLTASYIEAAVAAALAADASPADRAAGFVLGLGVALDDGDALRADPLTAGVVRAVEPDAAREERLAAFGNPTVRGRRDLCRRLAVGCVTGGLLPDRAAEAAVSRLAVAGKGPGGAGFPGLAAEWGGVRLAQGLMADPEALRRLRGRIDPEAVVPEISGLRDGLSAERLAEDYGDPADDRFRAVLADIRERLGKLPPVGR